MKLVFMKRDALDYFKTNLDNLYTNYFTKEDNSWMEELYGENPFEDFIEVPDFELADLESYATGEMELENCKIVYSNLKKLSESQAADERLWAGLCNGPFYDYLKRRWNNYDLKSAKTDISEIKMRFFFSGGPRSGCYSNTLAKFWWIGRGTYTSIGDNHFEKLDVIGGADFSTKVWTIFNSYTFSSNQVILDGIIDAIRVVNEKQLKIIVKEHLRPSLKYLNAYGGGTLLDFLSEEEIKTIVLKKMIELMTGQTNDALDYSAEDSENDEIIENSEYGGALPDKSVQNVPDDLLQLLVEEEDIELYVDYGDTVVVQRCSDKIEFEYEIPLTKGEVELAIPLIKNLLGKEINNTVSSFNKVFKVIDIKKRNM